MENNTAVDLQDVCIAVCGLDSCVMSYSW